MSRGFGSRKAWEGQLSGTSATQIRKPAAPAPARIPGRLRPTRKNYLQSLVDQACAAQDSDLHIPQRQEVPMLAVPKPRMSRRDRFKPRTCVQRYRVYGDELRLRQVRLPRNYHVQFHFPMPESWPESVKLKMDGKPKLSKPDGSNLIKAIEDHLVPNDEVLFKGSFEKLWARKARIVIEKGTTGEVVA